jgi:membrane AbrB-like protein
VLAVVSGFVVNALGLPAGFLTGPLIVASAFAVSGRSVIRLPLFARRLAQSVIGVSLSFSLTGKSLQSVAANWLPIVALVAGMLLLTVVIGIVLQRLANLHPGTALLGTLPGGSAEMVAISDSLGADTRLVAVMQYSRLLIILATVSMVGHFSGASNEIGGILHGSLLDAGRHSTTPTNYFVSVIIALIGAALGTRLRIPAGTLIIPAVLGGVAGSLGIPAAPWPLFVTWSAYLLLGLQIGGNFDTAVIQQLKRLKWFVLLGNAFLLAMSGLMAICLMPELRIDAMSAYLAATPGGLDSVAAMATHLNADTAIILAVHSLRLVSVVLIGPPLAQTVSRLFIRTKKRGTDRFAVRFPLVLAKLRPGRSCFCNIIN